MRFPRRTTSILLGVGLVWCVLSALALAGLAGQTNSPDEASNLTWAQRVATGQGLVDQRFQTVNQLTGNAIHLRSDNVRPDGSIVPGGFLGLPLLLGGLGRFVGSGVMPFIPLVLALIAGWCWYGVVRRLFDETIGVVSTLLLWFGPTWWYYALRGLLPNVLFCSLAIISLWLFVRGVELQRSWRGWRWWLGGGLALGLALTVRLAEGLWVAGVGIAAVIMFRSSVTWPRLVSAVVGGALPLGGLLWFQNAVYASPVALGYSALESSAAAPAAWWHSISTLLLPFGVHPRSALLHLWQYQGHLLWWYSLPLVLGVVVFALATFQRYRRTGQWSRPAVFLFVVSVALFKWLAIVYGSWTVHDNITGDVTIGTSYLRYWLPGVVALTPFAAWLAVWCVRQFRFPASRWVVAGFFGVLLLVLSTQAVFVAPEGILSVRQATGQYRATAEQAAVVLESSAIVVSDRSDKVFWPTWGVATLNGNWSVFEQLTPVVDTVPVYYYSHNTLTDDNRRILANHLATANLAIESVQTLAGGDQLYRLNSM